MPSWNPDHSDWDDLVQQQKNAGNAWKGTLERYNEGEIGPEVCTGGDDA